MESMGLREKAEKRRKLENRHVRGYHEDMWSDDCPFCKAEKEGGSKPLGQKLKESCNNTALPIY